MEFIRVWPKNKRITIHTEKPREKKRESHNSTKHVTTVGKQLPIKDSKSSNKKTLG